ncbi:MAG: hypothetical protein RDU13_02705 [Elusimicrobiales bacterium]|jgi:hypothetical protein|nr:hypothetical protein [Elusimicrobiales bacterium]
MMKITSGKKSKTTQYAVGGAIAVVIMFGWLSLPLMQKSSFDTSVPSGNPFRSKAVDLNSLEIPAEGSAPGYALSGMMSDNPATAGGFADSSLFSSGMGELSDGEAAEGKADGVSSSASASAAVSAPSAGAPKGSFPKMSAPGSLSGGNSNSMTAGGSHNKFFGSGNASAQLAPSSLADVKKAVAKDKTSGLMASLASVEKKSLSSSGMSVDESRGGASSAFVKTAAGSRSDLDTEIEEQSAVAGLELGKVDSDLKKNDPSINSKKFKPPEIPEPKVVENDEMYKQMIIQMIISQVLGPMFGAMMKGAMGGGADSPGNKQV